MISDSLLLACWQKRPLFDQSRVIGRGKAASVLPGVAADRESNTSIGHRCFPPHPSCRISPNVRCKEIEHALRTAGHGRERLSERLSDGHATGA